MTISQDQARSLAVRYHAYHDALQRCRFDSEEDHGDVAFWGRCLRARQRETGVDLLPDATLTATIDHHEAMRDRYAAKRLAELAASLVD
jgi:hypothetical protein